MCPMLRDNEFWSDVIITAAGTNEPFDEVNVITLRSYFSEMIYDQVFRSFSKSKQSATPNEIIESAIEIVTNNKPHKAYEQVIVSSSGITVVLDVDIITESVIFQAMNAILLASDKLDGSYGKINIGNGRVMTVDDLISF